MVLDKKVCHSCKSVDFWIGEIGGAPMLQRLKHHLVQSCAKLQHTDSFTRLSLMLHNPRTLQLSYSPPRKLLIIVDPIFSYCWIAWYTSPSHLRFSCTSISCPQPFTRVLRFFSSRIPIWKPYLHIYKSLFGVPLYALCLSVAIVTWQIFFIISSSRAPTKFQRIPPFLYNLLFHNHKTLALGKVWLFWFESLEYVFWKKWWAVLIEMCPMCNSIWSIEECRQCIKSCLTNLCESSAFFRISQGFAARWPNLCVSPEPQETPRNCILKSWTLLKTVQFWEVSS